MSGNANSEARVRITIGDRSIEAKLADSDAARDFASLLPLTLAMNDLFRREKFATLPRAISEQGKRTHDYAVGTIGYWPPGPDVAIFYRQDGERIPHPGLIVLGKIKAGVEALNVPGAIRATIELSCARRVENWKMNVKRVLILGVALFCTLFGAVAMSEQRPQQHIQIAEIEVDPAQLDSYKAAVTEQIEAAVRLEPGVLVLYSVSKKDNPAHVTVFEIYRDREAYLAHLQAPHFLRYKATVDKMVRSLKLVPVDPVMLGTKAK